MFNNLYKFNLIEIKGGELIKRLPIFSNFFIDIKIKELQFMINPRGLKKIGILFCDKSNQLPSLNFNHFEEVDSTFNN